MWARRKHAYICIYQVYLVQKARRVNSYKFLLRVGSIGGRRPRKLLKGNPKIRFLLAYLEQYPSRAVGNFWGMVMMMMMITRKAIDNIVVVVVVVVY